MPLLYIFFQEQGWPESKPDSDDESMNIITQCCRIGKSESYDMLKNKKTTGAGILIVMFFSILSKRAVL